MYFAVQSMTSVGYGDVGPATLAGQILTILYLPFSLWFMSVFLNLVAQLYIACHRWNIRRIVASRKWQLYKFNDLEMEQHQPHALVDDDDNDGAWHEHEGRSRGRSLGSRARNEMREKPRSPSVTPSSGSSLSATSSSLLAAKKKKMAYDEYSSTPAGYDCAKNAR